MVRTDYSELFNDKRLSDRGQQLLSSLYKAPVQSIQSLASTRAEQKAYYRFLNSKKTDESLLSKEIGDRCAKAVTGKTVLCIQDTTEVNLFSHINRLQADSGIGPLDSSSKGWGFRIHPCLVVDADNCFPYGYAGIDVFNRPLGQLPSCKRRRVSIEEKESGKWFRGNKRAGEYLSSASSVIIIQDREGDIYEQFLQGSLAKNNYLLVRCKSNRYLSDDKKLWDEIDSKDVKGKYKVFLPSDGHNKTPGREALMQVKIAKVDLKRPAKKIKGTPAVAHNIYAIETKEITGNVKAPIHWRLLTTWPVKSFAEARQIIEWYTNRWMIEEVFRVLKKECYNIEASEMEQGWAIRKLSIMILDTIIKLFQMLIAYNAEEGEEPISSAIAFEEDELQCLEIINTKIEGKTNKLSNSNNIKTLKGAVWVIARMGGWKGYTSQRKPGATTLIKGMQKFYSYYEGYVIQKDVGTR